MVGVSLRYPRSRLSSGWFPGAVRRGRTRRSASSASVTDATFVGVSNYQKHNHGSGVLHALVYTVPFDCTTVVINVVAFAIARMLTKAIKGSTLFRSVFFMLNPIGGRLPGYIWLLLLNGALAHWVVRSLPSGVYGLGHERLTCWREIGYMMIIYIGGSVARLAM